ncbi:transglycosylase domain-containing protein [Flavobacterium ginsengisoli]|uniref:transglycosylase domain-containing protein n=1 Tax=Flavobacterium ginsengisoli TaxID=871694 RepID=UPI0024158F85|nr:transglycosylase domain-containing protein [Flavobacterium ginsengisoli]
MKNKIKAFLQRIINWIKKNKIKSAIAFLLLLIYYFSIPRMLFKEPYSTVIESKEGELLGAKIARDGQWRFPAQDSVPDKFKKCIVYFEDEYFYNHPGFNPGAMINAFKQNRKAGKVVRGGSTLTQQVIRLSRKGKNRTYFEKIIEIILATRLELGYSKNEILEMYASTCSIWGKCCGIRNGFVALFWRSVQSIILGRKCSFGSFTECAKFNLSWKKSN